MDYEPDDFEVYNQNEADDYRGEGDSEGDVCEPTNDPGPATPVYAWSDTTHRFEPVAAYQVVCSECGESYNPEEWEWDHTGNDYPFLVCSCGQQFYQTN